ncbi:(S)-ureidoglycine aminohydrolase [Roseovarius arcticus]|uniref:(S)-ureidoglycine aminohydrolase n=1 Tax=Roseovarius arcticus TaxID=2547404 RepID=UPI00111081BE|nr:(S)-ureidoglycine aminohydrolase [Roseovarius arcticus]
MRQSLGESRSAFHPRHALISPDSHERVRLPLWPACELIHLITPNLGADFSMFLVHSEEGAQIGAPRTGVERFVLLRNGAAKVAIGGNGADALAEEGYAYLPAECDHEIEIAPKSTLIVLERRYLAMTGATLPPPLISRIGAHTAVPMKGDERLMLQKLIPEGAGFDMEINVMDFAPGASLPYVETHFMEHGLILLNGGGVYRLDNSWYPVDADDAIWMGPFCPQWFGAIGRGNARYLIYKNWNRDPLGA